MIGRPPPAPRRWLRRRAGALVAVALAAMAAGCGGESSRTAAIAALQREARPIGRGPRFESRATGPVAGRCRARLGDRIAAHIEVFARDRVVLLPTGIGVRGPVRLREGRIAAARCYGEVVTLDPTGTVLTRRGSAATLATVFHSWGISLSATQLAGFTAPRGSRVRLYVDGRRSPVDPRRLALSDHAEIVLEVGPYVPPHHSYEFPPGD